MEVKGGLIEYDGPQDQWTQNGNPLKTGPERQASANTHSAIDFLGPMVSDINVGWCICFPNCSWPANAGGPSGVVRSIIIDEAGLLEVARSVDFINTYYKRQFKREGCTKRVAGDIVNKLTRGIGFVRQMGTRIAKDSKQLLEVTQEQFNVLEDLAVNPRMAIKGYAGSGKTLLAQEFARRKLEQGKSVLLLFFNRMIVNKVRYGFDRNSRIDCQTFHSFARARIAEVHPGWWNEQEKRDEEFWNTDVHLKLADINIQEDQKYDTIIVDEGQDFKRSWFETLESDLTDTERGSFIVFYDENQDVFKHWEDLPWRQAVARKVLTKNCRNTKKIVGYLKAILNCDMKTFEK